MTDHDNGLSGWGIFFLILFVLIIFGGIGWILRAPRAYVRPRSSFVQYRARRLGLPAPSLNPFRITRVSQGYSAPAPAPTGIVGWVRSKVDALRNRGSGRTAGGAYESTGYGGGGGSSTRGRDRRGFGPLDPDEAWDSRVGNEAYYEEQELGLQDPNAGPYGGSGYGGGNIGIAGIEEGRGRSRSMQRELDDRYDEETGAGGRDPFGQGAERSDMSLRGVSPKPVVDAEQAQKSHRSQQSLGAHSDSSPSERRSMFRENM
ncbi:hypothetical protein MBLNU459_g7595t1 [Dothideomycetes sp. NU459]